jgi:hypothetical protein
MRVENHQLPKAGRAGEQRGALRTALAAASRGACAGVGRARGRTAFGKRGDIDGGILVRRTLPSSRRGVSSPRHTPSAEKSRARAVQRVRARPGAARASGRAADLAVVAVNTSRVHVGRRRAHTGLCKKRLAQAER